jgi:fatty acid desaturase
MKWKLFRYPDGATPNSLAIAYAFGGYAAGWYLITRESIALNGLGVFLLAHAMIIAAYLIHECAHNTLFARNEHHAWLGQFLLWMTGACYCTYEGIRHKHFRHHVDRADVVAFNFRHILLKHPVFLRCLQWLEVFCIPALDILMHWMVPLMPFVLEGRRAQRLRVIVILLVRGLLLTAVAIKAPRILLLYPLAYMLMLHVLRFMDAFQHTFELFETLESPPGPEAKRYDAAFEFSHTYTNLHSEQYPWLNLFTLNFGYHNAHHEKPTQPWYRLPALSKNLFGDNFTQVIPFGNQIRCYFRYRVQRITHEDPIEFDVVSNRGANFIGVDGVSFLTGH